MQVYILEIIEFMEFQTTAPVNGFKENKKTLKFAFLTPQNPGMSSCDHQSDDGFQFFHTNSTKFTKTQI